jgi:hypothetical protein
MASANTAARLARTGQAQLSPFPATAGRSSSARAAGMAFFQAGARSAENAQACLQPEYSEQQLMDMLTKKRSEQVGDEQAAAKASPGPRQAELGAALEAAAGAGTSSTGQHGVPVGKHGEDLLPARNLDQQQDARLVGGKARIPARLAAVGRSFLEKKEIGPSEFAKFGQGLNMGSQVPHAPTLASMVGWGLEAESQSSPLIAALQHGGLARREGSGAEALLGGIFSDLQNRAKKDNEAAVQPAIKDFKAFVDKLMKLNLLAPALAYTDPQSYWTMDRHFKSVVLVMTQHGWPVAAEYHTREMKMWASGHHDTTLYTDSPEYQSGHFEAAISRDSLYMALLTSMTSGAKAASGSSRSERSYTPNGTTNKANATDTYCEHHKLHYAAKLNHSSATCRAKGGKGRG